VAGTLLLGSLIRLQLFLSARVHRTFNQLLLGATVVAVIFLGMLLHALIGSSNDLHGAKADAFDSIDALSKARATAYDANGEESRWLLTRGTSPADAFEKAFMAKSDEVVRIPSGQTYDALANAATASKQAHHAGPGMSGDLQNELDNITFPGELDAAANALRTWGVYMHIDGEIRSLEASGRHADAIQLCCGNGRNESNGAFDSFDVALMQTVKINTDYFEKYRQSGKDRLAYFEPVSVAVAALVFVLAYMGLRPRFQEYAI
jgi:hypothetical protein